MKIEEKNGQNYIVCGAHSWPLRNFSAIGPTDETSESKGIAFSVNSDGYRWDDIAPDHFFVPAGTDDPIKMPFKSASAENYFSQFFDKFGSFDEPMFVKHFSKIIK